MSNGDGDGVTPIRYGIFESTVGQIVARAYRVDPLDHDHRELITVMDGVRDVMDAKERMDRLGWYGVGDDSYAARKARLVEYLRDGGLVADLCEDDDLCERRVQMQWGDVQSVFCRKSNHAKPSRIWLMGHMDWYRLEAAIADGETAGRALARELNLGLSTLQALYTMYDSVGRVRHARFETPHPPPY